MVALDLLQLAEGTIVLDVRTRRPVQHVVVVRCLVQHGAQLGGAAFALHDGDGGADQPFASSSSTCIATVTSRSSSSSAAFGNSVSAQVCSSPRA